VAAASRDPVLEPWQLPDRVRGGAVPPEEDGSTPEANTPSEAASTKVFRRVSDEVRDLERSRMVEALEATGGVQTRAAKLIGMPLRTFVLKLKEYGLGKHAAPASPRAQEG